MDPLRGSILLGGIGGGLSLPLFVLAAMFNVGGDGDFRDGPFPWLMAAAAVTIALFGRGLGSFVEPANSRLLWTAAVALLVGALGLVALWGGIAIGAAFGVDEPTGLLGMFPIAAGITGLGGFLLGWASLAVGLLRHRILPRWASLIPTVLLLEIPVAMVLLGEADGALEDTVFVLWLSSLGLGLAVLGYSMARSDQAEPGNAGA